MSGRAYTCDTTLCEISQTLFEGPYTEYVFQFTFPDHMTGPIDHKFEQDDLFISHIDDKALPPSCEMDDKGVNEYNNGIVVYELFARIPRKLRDLKVTQQITFYLYRLEVHPNPLPKTVSKPISHRLRVVDDGVSLREFTTGEAFKEKLHPSPKTRTTTFDVCVTAPTVIVLGEEFPLTLAIHRDSSSNDHDNYRLLSSLSLKEYSISVQGRFVVRAGYAMFIRTNDEVGQCEKIVEVSKRMDSVPLTLDEAITLDTIKLDPTRFAPTFKSFQMTGSWTLHVKAKVMCVGKEFIVFILFGSLIMLSPKIHFDMLDSAADCDKVVESKGEVPACNSSNLATDMKKSFNPFYLKCFLIDSNGHSLFTN